MFFLLPFFYSNQVCTQDITQIQLRRFSITTHYKNQQINCEWINECFL